MFGSFRSLALCSVAVASLSNLPAATRALHAQSVGLEAGFTAVENFSWAAPTVGVSLILPFTDRLKAAGTYTQWTGSDESGRYGNRAVNVVGLFRLFGEASSLHSSLGAGAGWYEMFEYEDDRRRSRRQDALTFATEVRVPVAMNSAVYLRGDVSLPTDDQVRRWTALRLGVDVGIF